MKNTFNIGDRVRLKEGWQEYCNSSFIENVRTGDEGIIVELGSPGHGVDFGRDVGGHDCDGNCKDGQGQYILPQYLEKVKPRKKMKHKSKKRSSAKTDISRLSKKLKLKNPEYVRGFWDGYEYHYQMVCDIFPGLEIREPISVKVSRAKKEKK